MTVSVMLIMVANFPPVVGEVHEGGSANGDQNQRNVSIIQFRNSLSARSNDR